MPKSTCHNLTSLSIIVVVIKYYILFSIPLSYGIIIVYIELVVNLIEVRLPNKFINRNKKEKPVNSSRIT